jgi:CubicO group peptidase (beta-lactamase class C family)
MDYFLGIHVLVVEGKLDLDAPMETYLTRWKLPKSEFDHSKATIKTLLSHTSGLIEDIGYAGFGPGEKVRTIEESLTNAADGYYEGAAAKIDHEPGSKNTYSVAGYTILQLIIEEVCGASFQEYLTEKVFVPLQMNNSTFDIATKPNAVIAQRYTDEGTIAPRYKFTVLAATSLYTTTEDLSRFMIIHVSKNKLLSKEVITIMSEPFAFRNDISIHGMGPTI